MIVSISQEYIFYNDKPPEKHNHRPYFLCRSDTDVPKLDKRVVEIGDIEQYDSWVNWGQKVNVRRIYINHPKSTPSVSNIYYKAGFENYENGVPYLQRVVSDLCAQGMWPLNTNNEKVILKCVIYDFEVVNGFINCCGIGHFNIAVTSSMNLDNEKFDIKFELLDKEPVVTQLLANSINEELNNILIPLIRIMKESHILIGHNILSFDNQELLNRLSEYKENNEVKDFINIYTYSHNAFYRGRISNSFEIYPISFDTLLASRFLFKDFAEGQYGLKVLAPLLDVDVTKYSSRSSEYNKRILERDFEGFGNWSNNNPLCLQYNRDDIYQTFGIFTKMFKEILTYMFITGMPFQEVVSGANTKIADYMTLIRCYKKKICPPVVEPIKVARALMYHFKGETPSKKEIFDFFRQHECNDSCLSGFKVQDNNNHLDIEVNNVLEETEESEDDIKHFDIMINKLYRCVRYGIEMPDYVEYYPLLLNYLSVGGMIFKPKISIQPLHNVFKADVSAQYPSILKAKNIVCDSVKLCRKDETPDGWCWFRNIGSTSILDKFNWKYADEPYVDKMDEYPKQYFIGYRQKGEEGVITKALTGIMEITSRYKKIPEWQDVYQRTLKPLRNSLTHGILLSLEATSMQYNIAGTAIPTYGQIITNKLVKEFNKAGWKLLEADSVHPNRNIPIINNGKLLVDRIGTIIDKAMSLSNLQYYTHNGVTREYLDLSNENIYTLSVSSDGKSRISKVLRYIRHKYKGKMLKIETPSGSTIVTPNHSLFTLVDKKLKVIDASMLKVSDGIVTLENHIVHKLASSTKRNSDISKQNDIVLSYISKIEEIDYEGYVYDLEVDIDNNFIDATGVLLHNTDGAEFIKDVPDAKDFATVVAEVEDYWNKQFDYPISFDIEHHAHKVYLAHKNYVTIKDNKVKLTGATLHASDKPNIAENIMKKLMLEILPISNTKEEFLNNIRKYTTKIINAQFKDLKLRDLVMISSIKPPADYTSNNFRLRAEAIERVLNRTITFPTKIEFLVCKKPLPNVPANKTSSDPIAYMWPKEIVEEQNIEIDYEWYKNMIYTYIDSCFGLEKSSSRHSVKSLVGFDQENIVEEARKIPFKTYVKQKKLF